MADRGRFSCAFLLKATAASFMPRPLETREMRWMDWVFRSLFSDWQLMLVAFTKTSHDFCQWIPCSDLRRRLYLLTSLMYLLPVTALHCCPKTIKNTSVSSTLLHSLTPSFIIIRHTDTVVNFLSDPHSHLAAAKKKKKKNRPQKIVPNKSPLYPHIIATFF